MKFKMMLIASLCAISVFGCGESKPTQSPEAAKAEFVANLQTAFEMESNATQRFKFFAEKTKEFGYNDLATLYRAAARSSDIHAQRHGLLIKSLGAGADAQVQDPALESVRDALKETIEHHVVRIDERYTAWLKHAKAHKATENIVNTFKYGEKTQAFYKKSFENAISHLEDWRVSEQHKVFSVCGTCGYTKAGKDKNDCPVCDALYANFEVFE